MLRSRISPPHELPEGFLYLPDFIAAEEEQELLRIVGDLEFAAFDFHGYTAKRRVVEYGYEYDFGSRKAREAPPIPDFLIPLRR